MLEPYLCRQSVDVFPWNAFALRGSKTDRCASLEIARTAFYPESNEAEVPE